MFKVKLVTLVGGIESHRELHKFLQVDDALRRLCRVRKSEPYDRSTMMRFRHRVGPERLQRITFGLAKRPDRMSVLDGEVVALDEAFIEA